MRKWYVISVLFCLIVTVGFIPYETIVIPPWKLRVTDENATPYSHKQVQQTWKHYTLEVDAADNLEDRWTDVEGYVSFPQRTICASLIVRCVMTLVNGFKRVAHGSLGISGSVAATGPQGYKRLEYDSKKPISKSLGPTFSLTCSPKTGL